MCPIDQAGEGEGPWADRLEALQSGVRVADKTSNGRRRQANWSSDQPRPRRVATSERRLRHAAPRSSQGPSRDAENVAEPTASQEGNLEAFGPLLASFASSLLQSLPDAVLAVDAGGRTVLVNAAGKHVFGGSPGARVDLHTQFFLADGQTPCHVEDLPLERALRGEVVPRAEFVLRGPAAFSGRYQVSARPVLDAGGAVRGALLVARPAQGAAPSVATRAVQHAHETRLIDEAIEAATRAGEKLMVDMESGTHPIGRGPSLAEVESACNEVDIALAEVAVCIDLLAQADRGEPDKAASDARAALRRICVVVDGLRSSCQRGRASIGDRTPSEPVAWVGARRRF
ncbi:MAG: PAS domain-containing protein [Myxococcales bacterium]|nr:PAS domain-containing protein [Myxococcales bacterium]